MTARVLVQALMAALLGNSGAANTHAEFPSEFLGAWAESLEACEPELTAGFRISGNEIVYYEGWDTLISISNRTEEFSFPGLEQVVEAGLTYTHADGPGPIRTVLFLLIDGDLYMSRPEEEGAAPPDRYIRCPPGGTTFEAEDQQ